MSHHTAPVAFELSDSIGDVCTLMIWLPAAPTLTNTTFLSGGSAGLGDSRTAPPQKQELIVATKKNSRGWFIG